MFLPNFVTVSQPAAELLRFVGKIQNGGVRHFELVYSNSGPPTKSTYGSEIAQQIGVNRTVTFQDIVIFKFLQIWLKTPIEAPKLTFLKC